ncbi:MULTISPECIES: chaperone modulator CbpM [Bradyrhizobium]|uniref:Chaperone modulatory protein CbpM n=2 Tax=Bradyrhizobium TaxID=374 RepID=A0ABY0P8C5_9BRAD|nr:MULTISPECIES: chaperone modulator CbpM [Bradyrhizobium]SDH67157.1 chaperone modulatory protein CbpM [Bradyrhizobium ottawaense]SEE15937.1 chaperone modulatory protein CbpM [Bradyrhizobium lablabi]SHM12127.1 chaperone modulatory protein CbpM [Bradyrhizobium lablabi]
METQEFISRSHLDAATLNVWIDEEWLIPRASGSALQFSDADLARARLIRDLKLDLGVNDKGIAIILHLLDQLHGLRSLVRDIHAIETTDRAKDSG